MTVGLSSPMFLQFFNPNNSGSPAAGYKLFTYQAGSSTKQATYTDSSQTTQNSNPIILDAQGRASVWTDIALSYKYVVSPPNDTDPPGSPIWSQDNIIGGAGAINVPGIYQSFFQSGPIQYRGPTGLAASNNFIAGLSLPNPSGSNAPAILLGSGGGGGTAIQAWLITDQAFDNSTPGNTLGITAGETQGAGVAAGGPLTLYGGGAFGGKGGAFTAQGGTSANAGGGDTTVSGGNATGSTGAAVPGELFLIGGQVGKQGANVHLIATDLNGTAGDVRIRSNSTILQQFMKNGEIYLTKSGTAAGVAGQVLTSGGLGAAASWTGGNTTASPGYHILQGGTILQWGGITTPAAGPPTDISVTFPLAFPTVCFGVFVCCNRNVVADGQSVNGSNYASAITTSGCKVTIDGASGSTTSHYFAIGR